MEMINNNFIKNFLSRQLREIIDVDAFFDQNLMYDYNEVQELFFNEKNYQVFLLGKSNLNKFKMLKKIVFDLSSKGISDENIIFLDLSLPFLRTFDIKKHIKSLTLDNEQLYLVINEISLLDNWEDFIIDIKEDFPDLKLIASSSVASVMHEYFYDLNDDFVKIVVLSEKNYSNIKFEQATFGVFDDFKYNIKDNICEIKGLTKAGKLKHTHIIPSSIDGYTVKVIASGAFHHRTEIEKITLPDTIEYIGDYAFTRCINLSDVCLPKNLKYIGDCAFLGAKKLNSIIGGEQVVHIGNSAFYDTQWLRKMKEPFVILGKTLYKYQGSEVDVTIPKGLETIGFYCFSNSNIRSLRIDGKVSIKEGAFYNCINLRNIYGDLSNEVQAFQFFNCRLLEKIDFPMNYIGKFAFYNCESITRIDCKSATIQDNAFENCLKLNCVRYGLVFIGKSAFYNSPIAGADLRKSKIIDMFAFYNSRIFQIDLPIVEYIGDYAFSSNCRLDEVVINPQADIGRNIFKFSNNIKKANLSGKYPLFYYFDEKSKIIDLTISKNCINNINRDNDYLEKLTICCENIGHWAFYNNQSLKTIKLNIKEFGAWSFAYCNSLESVDIPSEVNYIEMNAFRYCLNLKRVDLRSASMVRFGANAFYSTNNDISFCVSSKEEYLKSDLWQSYCNNIIEFHEELSNLVLTDAEEICDFQYQNDLNITTLSIGNKVKKIGLGSFESCENLSEVNINLKELDLDNWAFRNCRNLKNIDLHSDVLNIYDGVFDNCENLKKVIISGKTSLLGTGIFRNCKSLNYVQLDESIDYLPDRTFTHCVNLTYLKLPENLKKIGYKCFQNCSSLSHLILPDKLEEIGDKSFRDCLNLKYVFIPNSIKKIGESAFDCCSNLIFIVENKEVKNFIKTACNNRNIIIDESFNSRYQEALKEAESVIGVNYSVKIDRPIGIQHPKHPEVIYPINYGYVENLFGGDGEEQDVYIVDSKNPQEETDVKIIAVVFRQNDNETKWIGISNENSSFNLDELYERIYFQEQFYNSIIISST